MFRSATLSAANVTNLMVGGVLIVAMVNIPLFSAVILGGSPLEGGLRLMRLTVMIVIGAIIGGLLCQRLGNRLGTGLGLAFGAVGFYLMSRWDASVDLWTMTIALAICGFGFGLVIAPIGAAVLGAVAAGQRASASALVTVMRMVGMMVGLSAITSWGLLRFNTLMAGVPLPLGGETAQAQERLLAYQQQVTQATITLFDEVFLASSVICLLALVPVFLMRR